MHLSLYNSQLIQKHHNTFSEHCAIGGGGEVSLVQSQCHCPQGTQPGEIQLSQIFPDWKFLPFSMINGQVPLAFVFFSILFFKSLLCLCSVFHPYHWPHTRSHSILPKASLSYPPFLPMDKSKKPIDPLTIRRKSSPFLGGTGKLCGISIPSKPEWKSILTFEPTLHTLKTSVL